MKFKLSDKLCDRLTARLIEREIAREQGRPPSTEPRLRRDAFDAVLPGLHLRCSDPDSGGEPVRSWGFFYRFGGKAKRLTLGRFPAVSTAAARKLAGEALAAIDLGEDPAVIREQHKVEAQRAANDTVANLFADYLDSLRRKNRRAIYLRRLEGNFRNWILPAIGQRNVASLTRRELAELIRTVARGGVTRAGKTLVGGGFAANRLGTGLTGLFRYAVDMGIIDASVAERLPRQCDEISRDRILDDGELAAVWRVFTSLGYPWGTYGKLLLLTGARRCEVGGMRCSELDLQQGLWRLPGARSKNRKPHVIHLSRQAIELLQQALGELYLRVEATDIQVDDPPVFSPDGVHPLSGFSSGKAAVDTRVAKARVAAGLPPVAPWHWHDLRRTTASAMTRLGIPRLIVSKLLNHSEASDVTGIYDRHSYADEQRQAWQKWADQISHITAPRPVPDITTKTG